MSVDKIKKEVYACIILHNMILKNDINEILSVYIRAQPVESFYNENIDQEFARFKYTLPAPIWSNGTSSNSDYPDSDEDVDMQ